MTKTMDALMFQYYAKNDRLRITDLHQGIVWGTQTRLTQLNERPSTALTMTAIMARC